MIYSLTLTRRGRNSTAPPRSSRGRYAKSSPQHPPSYKRHALWRPSGWTPSKQPPRAVPNERRTHGSSMDKNAPSRVHEPHSPSSSPPRCNRAQSPRTTAQSHETKPALSSSSRRRARRATARARQPMLCEQWTPLVEAAAAAASAEEHKQRQHPTRPQARIAAKAKAAAAAAAKAAAALATQLPKNRNNAAPWHGPLRRDANIAPTQSARQPADPGALSGHSARVRAHISEWERIGAHHRVLRWLREGVRPHWIEAPPQPFHHGVGTFSAAERAWLTIERDRCLRTGAWVSASARSHVSRAFVTYHKSKPRLVIDLRHVNNHTRKLACRFEPLSSLRRMCRRNDWAFSLDLSDAYHHVPFHPDAVKYFTFAIETIDQNLQPQIEYFSTPVLNFGWTNSPAVFTEVLKPVVAYLRHPRQAGAHREALCPVRTLPWLDDFAFFLRGHLTYAQACTIRDSIHNLFADLGLAVSPDKGSFDPTHFLPEHLGYSVDTSRGLFLLTRRREQALVHGAHHLLHLMAIQHGWVSSRALASFAGLAEASGLALPLARFMLRALYDDLKTRRGWGGKVLLSSQSRSDLRWWTQLPDSPAIGRAIWRPPETRHLWTDASDLGWGGALQDNLRLTPAHGFWAPHELDWHITLKELVAVRKSVQHFLPYLTGHRTCLHEDNMAVVWILTHLVSRSPVLMRELRTLWGLLAQHDISLHPVYVASASNIVADAASRMADSGDYQLSRKCFDEVQHRWGRCTVDAFASPATAMLPRYWTRRSHSSSSAAACDAFAQPWHGEVLWLHPPPHLLPSVLQRLEEPSVRAYVCVPRWPGTQWYGMLYELSNDVIHFPRGCLLPVAGDAHPRLRSWPLSVFRVGPVATACNSETAP